MLQFQLTLGQDMLNGRNYYFLKRPRFPRKSSQEFLLVDLINNLDFLAEDKEDVRKNVAEKALSMDKPKLMKAVREFGGVRAKKLFEGLFNNSNVSHAV